MSLEDVLEKLEDISEKVETLSADVTNLKEKERKREATGGRPYNYEAGVPMNRGLDAFAATSEHHPPVIGPRRSPGGTEIRWSHKTYRYPSISRMRKMDLTIANW